MPLPQWLRNYDLSSLRPDIIAGLSLAAFVIPEALAYASLADLPPVSGLYCYLVAGIAYALFGTSRQLAVGPTSALAIAVAASIAAAGAGDDPIRAVTLGSAVALLMGAVAIGGRYLGLANLAYFVSDTMLTGFKTGAALYIASTQLPKLFGLKGMHGNFFERIADVVQALSLTHLPSLMVGVTAVALFLALERLLPGRPTTLLVVAGAITAAKLLGFKALGIHVVGELPGGLPVVALPHIGLEDLRELIPTAFACFLLAFSESISVARSFAQKHGYEIDPEKELTAIGMANVTAGLAHGFPVAGGMSQSAVNDIGGARSPLSLLVNSAAIVLVLLFFTGLFRDLPEPVLGAIVLMAAKHLVKVEELKALRSASRAEFRIALVALVGVLAFGLLNGLLLAAVGALILLLARASRPAVVSLARDDAGRWVNRERLVEGRNEPGVLVVRSSGAWLYFNADHIRREVLALVGVSAAPLRCVVMDCSMVPTVDLTASANISALARTLKARNVTLVLAELRDSVVEELRSAGLERDLGPIAAHRTIETCVVAG